MPDMIRKETDVDLAFIHDVTLQAIAQYLTWRREGWSEDCELMNNRHLDYSM